MPMQGRAGHGSSPRGTRTAGRTADEGGREGRRGGGALFFTTSWAAGKGFVFE